MLRRIVLPAVAGVLALPVVFASAALPERAAADRAAAYILATQQPDGGFGGFGAGQTVDAVLALRSAGIDPATVTAPSGLTPADYLDSVAASAPDAATFSKFALGALALGLDPTDLGGVDLVAEAQAGIDPATGRYAPGNNFAEAVAILGLECTGNDGDPGAVAALAAAQEDGGGWGFGPDNAAIVIQALVAAGMPVDEPAIVAGIAYLRTAQLDDGGWGFSPEASDASTTASVIQGLIAAGEDVESATYQKPGGAPVPYLVAQQQPDGSFPGFDPAFAANLAVPALMGYSFCESAVAPAEPLGPATSPSPSPSPTVAAPLPPNAGAGLMAGDGSTATAFLIAAFAILAGVGTLAAACRR